MSLKSILSGVQVVYYAAPQAKNSKSRNAYFGAPDLKLTPWLPGTSAGKNNCDRNQPCYWGQNTTRVRNFDLI
jgi:hypothetical protein